MAALIGARGAYEVTDVAVGDAVGAAAEEADGAAVGDAVGAAVGVAVGAAEGAVAGAEVGAAVGDAVGALVAEDVVGALVGAVVTIAVVGAAVGAAGVDVDDRPTAITSSSIRKRPVPDSRTVTYDPTSPHSTRCGPDPVAVTSLPHCVAPPPTGSPEASPTQTSNGASKRSQQSERPYTFTCSTYEPLATCTDSHGSVCAASEMQKLHSASPLPYTPSMHAAALKSWPGQLETS